MQQEGYCSIRGVCFYGGDVKTIKGKGGYEIAVAAAK